MKKKGFHPFLLKKIIKVNSEKTIKKVKKIEEEYIKIQLKNNKEIDRSGILTRNNEIFISSKNNANSKLNNIKKLDNNYNNDKTMNKHNKNIVFLIYLSEFIFFQLSKIFFSEKV